MHGSEPTSPRLSAGRGAAWIGTGFSQFKQAPGVWIGIVVVWFVLLAVLAFIPGGSLATTLLGPVLMGGALLGARDQAASGEVGFTSLFRCFSDGHLGPLVLIGLFTLAAQIVIGIVVVLLAMPAIMAVIGHADPGQLGAGGVPSILRNGNAQALLEGMLASGLPVMPILLAVLAGLVLLLLLAMALWFAPALVVLGEASPGAALKASFASCWRHMGALTVYGLLVCLLLLVAVIPLGLGLLVAGPVLLVSIQAAYQDIYASQGTALAAGDSRNP